MAESQKTTMSYDEQLELIRWLIDRHDHLRSSMAGRAATVISADALLFAGAAFLLNRYLSSGGSRRVEMAVFTLCIGASLILLSASVYSASNAIAFVWQKTRSKLDIPGLPEMLFFHPSATVRTFRDMGFEVFEKEFTTSGKDALVKHGLGELMQITFAQHERYRAFRWSIRLLIVAIVPVLVCLCTMLIRQF